MAKRITIPPDATIEVARPNRWEFFVVDHERDESVPEGSKRLDCIVYFDDAIPQRKIRDVLAGMGAAKKKAVKAFLFKLSDLALEAHAAELGLTTEDDTEDAVE